MYVSTSFSGFFQPVQRLIPSVQPAALFSKLANSSIATNYHHSADVVTISAKGRAVYQTLQQIIPGAKTESKASVFVNRSLIDTSLEPQEQPPQTLESEVVEETEVAEMGEKPGALSSWNPDDPFTVTISCYYEDILVSTITRTGTYKPIANVSLGEEKIWTGFTTEEFSPEGREIYKDITLDQFTYKATVTDKNEIIVSEHEGNDTVLGWNPELGWRTIGFVDPEQKAQTYRGVFDVRI